MSSPVLPQAAGYGVVIGMGLFFSAVMVGLTKVQTRYTSHKTTSAEEFNSASRSIPPGLVAAGIVSAWTWAATLLQSSATAYKFGISGPWWYASGATIQILLFAMIASKLKQHAPKCHTFLEIVHARWGKMAHLTFLFFGLSTNVIVSTMLILGGSATVADLTGMSTVAACFLIPLGVCIYVLAGGMRATLIADWSHTLVLYCILIAFAITAYATSPLIGSPARMWELLTTASLNNPVSGNAGGSYLTMRSKSGLIFGVLNIVGNFGTVFADQAYFQRAIASQPQTSVKAFLWGGVAWFGIPMGIATSLGLSAVALAHGDSPLIHLTSSEVSAGLPAVKAAAALLGQSGAVAMLILLFLAVTSACSAEQIAVSSLLTYDVYGTYINTRPTEKQILWCSHLCIFGYALFMGAIATAFNYIGVSMGYLYELMGTIIGSAVAPIALCITWRRCNGNGAVAGAIIGFAAALAGWLGITASLNGGVINLETTFGDYEMLTGNLLAIGVSGIITVSWSLLRPQNFDWDITRAINNEHDGTQTVTTIEEKAATSPLDSPDSEKDKAMPEPVTRTAPPSRPESIIEGQTDLDDHLDRASLQKAFRFATYASITMTVILIFLIPLPLFFSSHIYPQSGFTAWVVVSLIWLFVGLIMVGLYPVWEARKGLASVWRGIKGDIAGRL